MSEPEEFYDEVPTLYHARIMGEDSQVELARRLLKSGMLIEKVVEETGVRVVGPYFVMTRESIQQERSRLYEKARHDEAQALYHTKREGIAKGRLNELNMEFAKIMIADGEPIDKIARYTGLNEKEIKALV